jgi:hypothetical protein
VVFVAGLPFSVRRRRTEKKKWHIVALYREDLTPARWLTAEASDFSRRKREHTLPHVLDFSMNIALAIATLSYL